MPVVSAELLGLFTPDMQRRTAAVAVLMRRRNGGVDIAARRGQRDTAEEMQYEEVNTGSFFEHQRGTFTGHGEGGNSGSSNEQNRMLLSVVDQEGEFAGDDRAPTKHLSHHMATYAMNLSDRCAAHKNKFGYAAMLPFLKDVMVEFLPYLVRDLADKLEVAISESANVMAHQLVRPVGQVCDDFLSTMRPLYLLYSDGPSLLIDVRSVLCQAQEALMKEVANRSQCQRTFPKVMQETVFPLLAVIIMACVPRPQKGSLSCRDSQFFPRDEASV